MILPVHITSIGALIVAAIASYTDIRTGKIYNKLTFPAAGIGIVTRAAEFAMLNPDTALASAGGGALSGLLGLLTGLFVIGFLKRFLKLMGHGDTKLYAALGAFVGPSMIIGTFVYFSLAFGLYCLVRLAWAFPWQQYFAVMDMGSIDLTRVQQARKEVLPLAPLITFGLLIAVIFEKQTTQFFGFVK